MYRAAVLAAVLLLWWLLGPWVLLPAIASLWFPRVRDRLRPERPRRAIGIGAAAVAVLAGLVVVVPDGWLPVPPGPGRWVTPAYVGRPAIVRPVRTFDVPQHPHLAANGASSSANDAWGTGTYPWAGPVGARPGVDTAWFGLEQCPDLAIDSRGRLVGVCGGPDHPELRVLDPESMRPAATKDLPDPVEVDDPRLPDELCAATPFYLDDRDRAVVGTADRRVLTLDTADGGGDADLTLAATADLTRAVTADDCLVALAPDWDGRVWFATAAGVVGAVDPGSGRVRSVALEEQVAGTLAVDEGGVYVVTTDAVYRLAADATGRPRFTWRAQYDRGSERKPGQPTQGSGTPPTLLPGGLLAIADNAEPRMHVVFLRRDTGAEVCEAAVFGKDAGATASPLVAVGSGVVVENNHGATGPLSTALGFAPEPGLARVDVADGGCEVAWTSDLVAPSAGPALSLETGLLYAYTKRPTWWGVSAWYLSALDVRTGWPVFSVRAGTGALMDGGGAAVTLGRDGSAYVGTRGGLVRVKDRE